MSGKKKWAAAAIAAGLLIGCGEDKPAESQSAENKSAEHEHHGHDHGESHGAPSTPAPAGGHEGHGGHAGHEMPAAAPEASAGHQHGSGHEGHHPAPKSGSAADDSHHSAPSGGHAGHSAPASPQAVHDHSGHSQPAQPAAPAHDHSGHSQPAAPGKAPEAPLPEQPASILSPDALDSPAASSVQDAERAETIAQGGSHAGHGGTYTHVDVGRSSAETATVYACPMHPEVTGKSPGTCPKCGMALVERREE